jgi:ribosomal protein S3AE
MNSIDDIENYNENHVAITITRIHGKKRLEYDKHKLIDDKRRSDITCKYETIEANIIIYVMN